MVTSIILEVAGISSALAAKHKKRRGRSTILFFIEIDLKGINIKSWIDLKSLPIFKPIKKYTLKYEKLIRRFGKLFPSK
jgi:hypothetical protein